VRKWHIHLQMSASLTYTKVEEMPKTNIRPAEAQWELLPQEAEADATQLPEWLEPDAIDYQRYGLLQPPFSLTTDPSFMYLSDGHKMGLSKVSYMIQKRQGLSVILGAIGSGKTMSGAWLYRRYHQLGNHRVAFLEEAQLPLTDRRSSLPFLRRVAAEFDLKRPRSISDQMAVLRTFMVSSFRERQNVVLIIDEAQKLYPTHLELIRQMLNFESRGAGKLFQIVLIGTPELRPLLSEEPTLESRVAVYAYLDALTREDTGNLISFRLMVAGRREPLFAAPAVDDIYLISSGVPRQICALAQLALIEAYNRGASLIDRPIVRQTVNEHYPHLVDRLRGESL
jgi:general secretion pathway protein A